MSLPSKTELVNLTVIAEEPGTEIFLLDDQSCVIQREVGKLETSRAPGVYKIKVRAGYADLEEILFLEGAPVKKRYAALPFYSPIPLDGTAARIESHVKAAERLTREDAAAVVIGEGSSIFIFARDFRCGEDENQVPVVENPAHGLSVKSLSGETLVDLQEQSEVNGGKEPWAGCLIQVDPGSYVLSCKAPNGKVTEQSIYATKGWHSKMFITQHLAGDKAGAKGEGKERPYKIPDLQGAALLVTEDKNFRAHDPNARLVELARLNLSIRRLVLAGTLRQMLHHKFEHPMLGIYGAHLLLLEPKLETTLFEVVIRNLRNLLGDSHPDVEALSLATNETGTSHIFSAPPMLRASWSLVVRATAKRPNLVPLGSMSGQVADCVLGNEPWLAWVLPGQAKLPVAIAEGSEGSELGENELTNDLVAVLESFVIPYKSTLITLPALLGDVLKQQHPIYAKLLGSAQEFIAKAIHFVSDEYGLALEHSAQTKSSVLQFTDDQIETLVQNLGLPRYNVEQLLYQNAPRIYDKLANMEKEASAVDEKAAGVAAVS